MKDPPTQNNEFCQSCQKHKKVIFFSSVSLIIIEAEDPDYNSWEASTLVMNAHIQRHHIYGIMYTFIHTDQNMHGQHLKSLIKMRPMNN